MWPTDYSGLISAVRSTLRPEESAVRLLPPVSAVGLERYPVFEPEVGDVAYGAHGPADIW